MAVGDTPIERLMNGLQADMVTVGIGRKPGVVSPLPPIWIQPPGGVPEPGERKGVENDAHTTIGLRYVTEIPPTAGGSFSRRAIVDLIVRTKGKSADNSPPVQRAQRIEHAYRQRYTRDYGQGLMLAAGEPEEFRLIASQPWTPFQPVEHTREGATFRTGFIFEIPNG